MDENNKPLETPQPPIQPAPQMAPPAPTPTPPPAAPASPTPPEKKPMSKTAMIIIAFLLIIALMTAGVIAYNLFLKPNNNSDSEKMQATNQTVGTLTPTPFDEGGTPSPTASPAAVQSEIVSALDAQNYDDLKPFMAPLVAFEIESSEGVPSGDPDETAENLAYLDTAVAPWNFDQTNPIITQIKTDYASEYGNLYIGISSNDVLAAFGFDENGMINQIKVAVTYKLLVQ